MKKELPDHRSVPRHVSFKTADVFEALFPDVLGHQRRRYFLTLEYLRMHSHHQHLLIIRTVKNPDVSPLRKMLGCPPQEIMLQFGIGGRFVGSDLASLGIYSGHNMFDRPIFARR